MDSDCGPCPDGRNLVSPVSCMNHTYMNQLYGIVHLHGSIYNVYACAYVHIYTRARANAHAQTTHFPIYVCRRHIHCPTRQSRPRQYLPHVARTLDPASRSGVLPPRASHSGDDMAATAVLALTVVYAFSTCLSIAPPYYLTTVKASFYILPLLDFNETDLVPLLSEETFTEHYYGIHQEYQTRMHDTLKAWRQDVSAPTLPSTAS